MATNTKALRTALLTAGMIATAGCATGSGNDFMADTSWGDANRRTMAAQVIDPNPVYDTAIPPTTAQNAVAAIDRYYDDAVKEPDEVSTTESPE